MSIDQIVKNQVSFILNDSNVDENTVIFGVDSNLDSLGLVSLLSDIEQQVYDTFHKEITIASEKAMSLSNSPFKTVGSLTNYVRELVKCE